MKRIGRITVVLAVLLFAGYSGAYAGLSVDVGVGPVFTGYNDLRAPNYAGSDLSLSEELKTDPAFFYKVKVVYSIRNKHHIGVFFAPLHLNSNGSVDRLVSFGGEDFPADTQLEAVYKLNHYRLSYRYDLIHTRRFHAGLGVTTDIRYSSIRLAGGGKSAKEKDITFTPLFGFRAYLTLTRSLGIVLEGDVLAVAQGRTEDVLLAIQYKLNRFIDLRIGYRMLEGGIDACNIYNFAMMNYFAIGPTISF
jgi:hypothetical protein